MSDNPYSPSWYRVADLRPRLKKHHRIQRHLYQGQVTYILDDRVTGDVYRFSPAVYRFIGLMNGERSIQDILNILLQRDYPDIPNQDQVIELLSQLHTMDALICDVPPDTDELLLRRKKQEKPAYLAQLKSSILFLRFPLFDPEKLLNSCIPYFAVFFTRTFLFCLLGIFFFGLVQLLFCMQDLTSNLLDTLFTRHNLIILWLIYPIIKAGHELAHALAVKKWGGEVHEIGVMFLLLLPVPYVNASASTTFSNKWQRIAVSGAGIMMELFLVSIALLIWPRLEPGIIKSIAFNVIMIGGLSTLLFNGNPLVRFDGYYVLSDLLELPNLAQRSKSYLSYLLLRHLFGIRETKTTPGSAAEKRWYLLYGLAAFAYRGALYVSIFLVLSGRYSWAGAIFALFGVGQLVLVPTIISLRRIFTTSSYRQYRSRILLVCASVTTVLVSVLAIIPMPYSTRIEGVLQPRDDSYVRMETHGFVKNVVPSANSSVKKDDILIECEDPQLASEVQLLQSQIKEYQARKIAAFATAPLEASLVDERLQELQERLAKKQADQGKLIIRSPGEGKFILPGDTQLLGRFIPQGEVLAYILATGNMVRMVISQQDIDIITEKNKGIELMIITEPGVTYTGHIATKNPQATTLLPDKALGTEGGGKILTDPADPSSRQMFEEMYQIDIAIDVPTTKPFIGSRVVVRFNHGSEPLAIRWLRKIRQLFLAEFYG